jgi:hypothetical protein
VFTNDMAFPGTNLTRQAKPAILLASQLAAVSLIDAAPQRRPKNDRMAMMTTTAPMM